MSSLPSTSRAEALSNIQAYASRIASVTPRSVSASDIAAAEARLDKTLAELQARVSRERARRDELQAQAGAAKDVIAATTNDAQLHSTDGPSKDPSLRLRQTRAVTAAYSHLAEQEPEMPPPNSSLPALLALQNAAASNAAVQQSMAETYSELCLARERLAVERSDLNDNRILQDTLRSRVQTLRSSVEAAKAKPTVETAEELARKRLMAAETQREASDLEARKCTSALKRFINERLAPMLAAEELGGPVAGTEPTITEEDIMAGFTAQGKTKKSKSRSTPAENTEASRSRQQRMRQQRIDTIWGPERDNAEDFADEDEEEIQRTEADVAASEMRDLVQELIDAVSQPSGSTTSYVNIARDSAAARFLVRANIAVLHRSDARRMRLQDYGRTVDD